MAFQRRDFGGRVEQGESAEGRMVPIKHEGNLPWVQLRNAIYHPNVFRKMVGRVAPGAENGDLVRVYDREGLVFGTGLLSNQSQIALRMLTLDDRQVGEEIIPERLAMAVRLRRDVLKLDAVSDAYRVVNA